MKNLIKKLAEFQSEVPVILKDTEGYGYNYADLPAIFEIIIPLMKKYNLAFTQLTEYNQQNDVNILITKLFLVETDVFLESRMRIKENVTLAKMNDYQVLGSAITYYRRYALSAILGLVTDEDSDAQGEQKETIKKTDDLTPEGKKKKWLNKGTPEYANALVGLSTDKTMNDIRKYYKVSKEVQKLLEDEKN